MTHEVKFYSLGNADTTLIKLQSGRNILFDYANMKGSGDADLRCDLPGELNKDVTNSYFDVVAFTHADMDHVKGFADYFYLEHAAKYQEIGRKKIAELWVPAQVILEEGCEDETRILRQEARHRLRNKKGIKVFSKPEKLQSWLDDEGIALDDVAHLIVNAGESVPINGEIEFFVHAPFAYRTNEGEIDRNGSCLVMQAEFKNLLSTKLLLLGDADWQLLHEIVVNTEHFKNEVKLHWDILHIAHHCSYLSLSPEKGETITEPVGPVKRLLEDYSLNKAILISPSDPISNDYKNVQPPHIQAYKYYKTVANAKDGEIKVTMEFPSKDNPKPLEITISNYGATIVKSIIPQGFVSENKAPKAG